MPKTTLKRTSPYYAGPHNMQSTHALTCVLLCPLSMSRLMDDVVLLLVYRQQMLSCVFVQLFMYKHVVMCM